jgi:hypothetical protein
MNKPLENLKLLNWLEKQKQNDNNEIKFQKEKLISEIKKIKKDDLFLKKKKLTLWERIKITLLGI